MLFHNYKHKQYLSLLCKLILMELDNKLINYTFKKKKWVDVDVIISQ